MQNQGMAEAAMSRAGYHQSKPGGDQTRHYTIERDNSLPGGTPGNIAGHIYKDGSGKACNGGSILWALPKKT